MNSFEFFGCWGEFSIPAIPLKGAALSDSLHGDVSLRVSTDLDVLVPRRLAARAIRIIEESGYRKEFSEGFFQDLSLRNNIEFPLTRDVLGIRIPLELHWGILWKLRWIGVSWRTFGRKSARINFMVLLPMA